MKLAQPTDKTRVIDILSAAFNENKSVNNILVNDEKRTLRIGRLMAYAFETCTKFGRVYLSDDGNGCALLVFPELKKTTISSLILDLKLVLGAIGVFNVKKTLKREAKIKAIQSRDRMAYLWFIGVAPEHQSTGTGKKLMLELICEMETEKRPLYLETSTLANLPWYEKFGFKVYHILDLGYELFFLRRD